MQLPEKLSELVNALKVLPGVGPKSAQRMAFYLLEHNRTGGERLGKALTKALVEIGRCQTCRNFAEQAQCAICANPKRTDAGMVCVVASPADVLAIEQTGHYQGRYFVLGGVLSPLDGIGPDELGMDLLSQQLKSGEIQELILATNPTIEGEATAHYIAEMAARYQVECSRIAQGIPVGGELELVDGKTLGHAFSGRKKVEI